MSIEPYDELQIYEFNNNKGPLNLFRTRTIEIIVLSSILAIMLLSLKLAYGQSASSLEELQSEVTNETAYRIELEGYAIEHNMSISTAEGGLYMKTVNMTQLEDAVKKHIQDCKLTPPSEEKGLDDATIKLFLGASIDGHC